MKTIYRMASIDALTKSHRAKREEISKLRKKSEDNLKKTLSLKRRSSSGLASLERKKESLIRKISQFTQLLNQFHAQKESIARLKVAAEERLKHEQDLQDSARQQIDYGTPEEKTAAQERLRFIDEKLTELHEEMKEREAAEIRLEKQSAELEKEKSRLDSQLKKQSYAKPGLIEQLKISENEELVLRPRVQSLLKREAMAVKSLKIMEQKLKQALAKRRTAMRKVRPKVRKATRKAKRRIARKIKIRRGARRIVTRKLLKIKKVKRITKRIKKTSPRRQRK